MKHEWVRTMFVYMMVVSLAPVSVSSAHGKDAQSREAEQMKILHAMMPMFSVAAANLETAIDKGESTTVKLNAEKILAAVPDLKKSKPHKNKKQLKKFVEFAMALEESVSSTADLAAKGDIGGAKIAFKKVEATCSACHAKFRD